VGGGPTCLGKGVFDVVSLEPFLREQLAGPPDVAEASARVLALHLLRQGRRAEKELLLGKRPRSGVLTAVCRVGDSIGREWQLDRLQRAAEKGQVASTSKGVISLLAPAQQALRPYVNHQHQEATRRREVREQKCRPPRSPI
jgi:hypothetical protein